MILGLLFTVLFHPGHPASSLESGDRMFETLDYASAIRAYDSVQQITPHNADLFWRLARVYVCLADITPREQREPLYRKSEMYARRAVQADSNNGYGHTWLAAALGNIAMYEGSKTKVKLCNEIKEELEKAIALNASDDIARSILGSFYRALGNISWIEKQLANLFLGSLPDGGYEDAEAALKEAIRLAPAVIRHRHELGLLYLDMDREEDAAREFRGAVALSISVASDQRRIDGMNRYLSSNSE